jgi:hypothetical protein
VATFQPQSFTDPATLGQLAERSLRELTENAAAPIAKPEVPSPQGP